MPGINKWNIVKLNGLNVFRIYIPSKCRLTRVYLQEIDKNFGSIVVIYTLCVILWEVNVIDARKYKY